VCEKGSISRPRFDSVSEFDRQLDHLYRFAGMVGSTLRVDLLLEDALGPLLDIAGADRALVSLLRWGSAEGTVTKHQGWDSLADLRLEPEKIAPLGTDIITASAGNDLPEAAAVLFGGTVDYAVAVVPLWAYGRPLGILALGKLDAPFDHSAEKLLHTAGRQLALSIENARLFSDLEMSYHHLLYTQEEMISSERMAAIGTLAATMAHEIRNPLATIFSSLSQIKKHAQVEGDAATLLQIAEEEAVRLNRIVSGLLEFARPGVPRFEMVAIVDAIKNVISDLDLGEDKGCKIAFAVKAEADDITAELDMTLFKKAMHHVLDNAIAAVDPGKGTVEISVTSEREQHGERDIVIVTVKDNGHGVTREIQNKVFEPFYSTKPSGIGLGLPTVARIVNDHGGMTTFDSQYKKGTTVRLAFYKEQASTSDSREK
jgi:signal transduction histidine kinase